MSETTNNTLTSYLGEEFQIKLLWQLLVEPEFAEKAIPSLAIEYFDDPNLKRFFIIILEFFNEYDKVPNLQNKSIHQAINKFKTSNNIIEEEVLFGVLKRIELWNENVINRQLLNDDDVIQQATNNFIKQQEYRKLGEFIIDKTKNGEIKSKYIITTIEDKFRKIHQIGQADDDSEEIFDNIERTLRREFRKTIPTGIGVIDAITGDGLGKGEIGVILTPSGVGKSTMLTKIANTAYIQEYNVAQIIFEDTKDQIKRKHYTIWSGVGLSQIDDRVDYVKEKIYEKAKSLKGKGNLIVKRFTQEDVTIKDISNWMLSHEKKYGYKFDILVLDYLDCLESHKKSSDRNEAELAIIKGFEALAAEFDIPAWTAIQSNRSGFDAEYIEAHQSGGSIKRIQKAHFFMSIAKTPEQKEAQLANIRIIKARFAADGQRFENCIFNNDTMEIKITDDRYQYDRVYKTKKHYNETDVDRVESKLNKIHVAASQLVDGENIGDARKDALENDMLTMYKAQKEIENTVIVEPVINKTVISEPIPDIAEPIVELPKIELTLSEIENDTKNPDELNSKQLSIKERLENERKKQIILKKE